MIRNYWSTYEYIFWAVHIPLILVLLLVSLCIWRKRRLLQKELKLVPSLTTSKLEADLHLKNFRIKFCTINLLLCILLIEFLPNAFAIISEATLYYIHSTLPQTYNLSNSCIIVHNPMLAARGMQDSGLLFLPFKLSLSFHLLLIPSLCFLLKFLRRAYLGHSYSLVITHWLTYLSLRFTILLFLMSFLSTQWLFLLSESVLYVADMSIYISYARRFYLVLLSRAIEARMHCEYSESITRSNILYRYRITILVISIPLTLMVTQVVLENVMQLLNLVFVNGCYFNHFSYGLIPTPPLYPNVTQTLRMIGRKVDLIWLVMSIVRKSMIVLLYLTFLMLNLVSSPAQWKSLRLSSLFTPLLTRKQNTIRS